MACVYVVGYIMSDVVVGIGSGMVKKLADLGDGSYAEVVAVGVVATDGNFLNIESLEQTLTYNADGTLNYVQVVEGTSTYRQTLTYTNGVLTGIGRWVKQ